MNELKIPMIRPNKRLFDIWRAPRWGGRFFSRRPSRWLMAIALGCTVASARAADDPDFNFDDSRIDRDARMALSHASVVKTIAPSVVTIYSEQTIEQGSQAHPFMDDPMFRRFFRERGGHSIPRSGMGSGVIMTEDGFILTNNHVVEDADTIRVITKDGKEEYEAEVVGTDPQTDIAVLKVKGSRMAAATFGDSDDLEVGDLVFAVGNPMGVGQTVSMGIVSALGRGMGILGREGFEDFIQTDAAINRGNSGGPLVDVQGRLVGINQSIVSGTGGSDGIGFAIPSNLAINVARQLITDGQVRRGFIGINIQSLSPDLADAFEIDDGSGALVSDVMPDSPGEDAGLEAGDVVVQYDGRKVRDSAHLRLMASHTAPGTDVDLKIIREGKGRSVEVRLGEREAGRSVSKGLYRGETYSDHDGLDGVVVDDLTTRLRRDMDLPTDLEGAVVTQVDPDSNAGEAGLRAGDVIVEMNRNPIESADDAVALSGEADDEQILLRVWSRNGDSSGLRYLVVDNRKDE